MKYEILLALFQERFDNNLMYTIPPLVIWLQDSGIRWITRIRIC